jgi:hypothetical protein
MNLKGKVRVTLIDVDSQLIGHAIRVNEKSSNPNAPLKVSLDVIVR